MRLAEAMKKGRGVYPGDGVIGRERATWYTVGKVTVKSGSIYIGDLAAIPEPDAVRTEVPNGSFLVEARLIDFNGSFCISRLRTRLDGTTPTLGPRIGEVSVDFGAVTVGDWDDIRAGLSQDEQGELTERAIDFMETFGEIVRYKLKSKTARFAGCKSGTGDGTYPVFQLRSGTKTVGLESEFVVDGHVLP